MNYLRGSGIETASPQEVMILVWGVCITLVVVFGTALVVLAILNGMADGLMATWYDWKLRAKQEKRETPSPGALPPEPKPDKWTCLLEAFEETIAAVPEPTRGRWAALRQCSFAICPVDFRGTCCLDCPDRRGCEARCMDCVDEGELDEALH